MPARHASRLLLATTLILAGAARADWTGEPLIDRMTDFEGWVARTVGEDFDAPEAEPTLWVRCRSGRTDISVFGIHPLWVINFKGETPVTVRFGDARPERLTWRVSSDGYGAFAADPIAFARSLATTEAERLLIRLTPTNRLPFDMGFSLDGVRAQIEMVAARCGWPLDPPPPQVPDIATLESQSPRPPDARPAEEANNMAAAPRDAAIEAALQSFSEGLRRHFQSASGPDNAAVTLEFFVNSDGKLTGRPKTIAPAGPLDPIHQALQRAAFRALLLAAEDGTFASFVRVVGTQQLRVTFVADGNVGVP